MLFWSVAQCLHANIMHVDSAVKCSVLSVFARQNAAGVLKLTLISKFPILVADRMMGRPTMAGKM